MKRFLLVSLVAVTALALSITPVNAYSSEAKLIAGVGTAGDEFGRSVSISGDTALVGAHRDDDTGSSSGSAYIIRHDGTSWIQEAKLTASDGMAFDYFGYSVSISGDTALIGAYGDDDMGSYSGSAYVFRYDGTKWTEEAKLTAGDGAAGDKFGRSVSISGDTALVGAHFDDDMGSSSGSAYVFRYDGTSWVQEAKLTAGDGTAFDYFAYSVSISEDTALMGAYGDDDMGSSSGSAYVFRYNGTSWIQEAKLTAGDGEAGDKFGWSVSISEDTALVGAHWNDDMGPSSGSAYVFRYDGTSWIKEAKLTAGDGAAFDYFGYSVSISGDTALIGGYGDDDMGSSSGSAYLFRYRGTKWTEETKLTAGDGAAGDFFGYSVSISGDTAVVGAYQNDDMGSSSGSLYVYQAPKFEIDHVKIDFKKKPDDDKVRVQGKLEFELDNGDGADISECVIVTVGSLSETIMMVAKGKKGEKWEYKRPKDGEGNIKHMTIDWKKGTFDIRMDKADLTGVTNPVTISIQIGDDFGEETIEMKEKKHHWDYKAPRH